MLRTSLTLFGFVLSAVLAAQIPPFGPEFPVGPQGDHYSGVSIADSGNFVIVWTGTDGIVGQRYNSAGEPQGDEFPVGAGDYPNVGMDSAENFVVVWQSDDGAGAGIQGRRFDSSGNPLGDAFQVNTYTTGDQVKPSIAVGSGGNFVTVWGGSNQTFGRVYDVTGTPLGDEFQVNQNSGTDYRPSVGADSAGNFVVAWGSLGIVARRFDSSGTPLSDEFQVSSTYDTLGGENVRANGTGDFVIAWLASGPILGYTQDVYAQRYDNTGQAQGDNFKVNNESLIFALSPHIGMDAAGNFIVVWSEGAYDAEPFVGVFGRQFDDAGQPQTSDFMVNQDSGYFLLTPKVAMNGPGSFVVSWSNEEGGINPPPTPALEIRGRLAAIATSTPAPTSTPTPTSTGTATPTATWTPSPSPTPAGGGLPPPWLDADVGSVGLPGSASYSSGTFTNNASGVDIWDNADGFHFIYQPMTGDGTVIARVTSVQNTDPWAKAAVMIRETLDTGSVHALTALTPGNGVVFQRRLVTDDISYNTSGPMVTAPYWVEIVRSGNVFYSYSSPDGVSWIFIGSDTVVMATTAYVGLALSAHNNAILGTATFDNVSVTPGSVPTPTPSPTPTLTPSSTPTPTATFTPTPTPTTTGTSTNTPTPTATPTPTVTPTPTPPGSPGVSSIAPKSGIATGGISVTITGSSFLSGATASIGGVPATGVTVPDSTHVLATIPLLPAGTLDDVTVTNPGGLSGTLAAGWLADFLDVPQGDNFHNYVETVFRSGITAGCGGGNYCRDNPVTRAQMAVFLLKAEHGAAFVPPTCVGIFPDVPCTPGVGFPDWIEQLYNEGITGGCGGGNYCPNGSVTRAQMSAFLLKTEHGSSYTPPTCIGVFGDVACPSLFAAWIEQLYAEAVTGGCQASPLLYCPGNAVTRGQMAVFLTKTFSLQ